MALPRFLFAAAATFISCKTADSNNNGAAAAGIVEQKHGGTLLMSYVTYVVYVVCVVYVASVLAFNLFITITSDMQADME